jgi:ribonuclease-3
MQLDICRRQIRDGLRALDAGKVARVFPRLDEFVALLERIQRHHYSDKSVARVALIHRSALVHWPSDKRGVFSNERIEFLGDSFLNYFVAVESMIVHPSWQEGELSKLRAAIVGTESLARKARELGLAECLILGKGESLAAGYQRDGILADAFESTTAALLLDAGEEVAWNFCKRVFADDIDSGSKILETFDAKSRFQQWVQAVVGVHPTYRVIGTESTPEKTDFIVGAFIGRTEVGSAAAPNKRSASKLVAQKLVDLVDSGEFTPEHAKRCFEEGQK